MTDLEYKEVEDLTRSQIEHDLSSGDSDRVAEALYSTTRYHEDWRWAQNLCLARISSEHHLVRWAAVTCLGDIAFLRRQLDKKQVIEALTRAIADPTISDPATFSLGMVEQYVPDQVL